MDRILIVLLQDGWGSLVFVDEQSDGRTDGSGPLLVPFLNKVFLRYRDPM